MSNYVTALTGGGVLGGRVAGAVLAAIRKSMPATQEHMAERLEVSLTTVQAWERGRKPLVNMPHVRLRALRSSLQAAGASPALLRVWDQALDADVILSGLGSTDPATHPLAVPITDPAVTELLTWPLTGRPPRSLAGTRASLYAGRGEIAAVTAALRRAADQADGQGHRATALKYQARLLLGAAATPPAPQRQAA